MNDEEKFKRMVEEEERMLLCLALAKGIITISKVLVNAKNERKEIGEDGAPTL